MTATWRPTSVPSAIKFGVGNSKLPGPRAAGRESSTRHITFSNPSAAAICELFYATSRHRKVFRTSSALKAIDNNKRTAFHFVRYVKGFDTERP